MYNGGARGNFGGGGHGRDGGRGNFDGGGCGGARPAPCVSRQLRSLWIAQDKLANAREELDVAVNS